jgi:hypothetical protein
MSEEELEEKIKKNSDEISKLQKENETLKLELQRLVILKNIPDVTKGTRVLVYVDEMHGPEPYTHIEYALGRVTEVGERGLFTIYIGSIWHYSLNKTINIGTKNVGVEKLLFRCNTDSKFKMGDTVECDGDSYKIKGVYINRPGLFNGHKAGEHLLVLDRKVFNSSSNGNYCLVWE